MSSPTPTPDSVAAADREEPMYRYERILVAVDGSPESLLALRRAEDIARRSGARLDLLCSAVVPSTIYWAGATQPMQINDIHVAGVLRAAAASVGGDVPVTSYLVRGNAAARIIEHADAHACMLIVMGSRGRGRIAAALFGSTSHAVLHAAHVPVLIVHGDSVTGSPRGSRGRRSRHHDALPAVPSAA
jgi:nucleotide-binding universal stress UspA family protein